MLLPSEVGQAGVLTRATRTAAAQITTKDREMFWRVTAAEMDEMRRRGMPPDAVRVRDATVRELRDARIKVMEWTFDCVELRVTGMSRVRWFDHTQENVCVYARPCSLRVIHACMCM